MVSSSPVAHTGSIYVSVVANNVLVFQGVVSLQQYITMPIGYDGWEMYLSSLFLYGDNSWKQRVGKKRCGAQWRCCGWVLGTKKTGENKEVLREMLFVPGLRDRVVY